MRIILIALMMITAATATAIKPDSTANSTAQARPAVNLSLAVPAECATSSLQNTFSPRHRPTVDKNSLATGLIIGGAICLGLGIPMLLIANKTMKDNNKFNDLEGDFCLLAGVPLTAAGIGLSIPGIILKSKYGGKGKKEQAWEY